MRAFALTLAFLATAMAQSGPPSDSYTEVEEYSNQPIDMQDMIHHSVVRRTSGESVNFWVHNSFEERDDTHLSAIKRAVKAVKMSKPKPGTAAANKKQKSKGKKKVGKKPPKQHISLVDHTGMHTYAGQNKGRVNKCGASTFKNITSASSPFTGGCQEIADWAAKRRGRWRLQAKVTGQLNLIVAGSNSGANCRFVVKNNPDFFTFVGTEDVRDLIRDSRRRFAKMFDGKQRMAAEGRMKCEYQKKNQTTTRQLDWAILRYDGKV